MDWGLKLLISNLYIGGAIGSVNLLIRKIQDREFSGKGGRLKFLSCKISIFQRLSNTPDSAELVLANGKVGFPAWRWSFP